MLLLWQLTAMVNLISSAISFLDRENGVRVKIGND